MQSRFWLVKIKVVFDFSEFRSNTNFMQRGQSGTQDIDDKLVSAHAKLSVCPCPYLCAFHADMPVCPCPYLCSCSLQGKKDELAKKATDTARMKLENDDMEQKMKSLEENHEWVTLSVRLILS